MNKFHSNDLIDLVKSGNLSCLIKSSSVDSLINSTDWSGMTALMHAVWRNNFDMVNILINNGSDVNLRTHAGRSALDIAMIAKAGRSEYDERIVEILSKNTVRASG